MPNTPRCSRPTSATLTLLALCAALPIAGCDDDGASGGDALTGVWMITSHTYAQGDCEGPGQVLLPEHDIAIFRDLAGAGSGALELLICRDTAGTDCDGLSGDYVRPRPAGGYGAETYVAQWTGSECIGTRRAVLVTLAASGATFHFDASVIQGAVPGVSDEVDCTLDTVEAAAVTATWPCVGRELLDAAR